MDLLEQRRHLLQVARSPWQRLGHAVLWAAIRGSARASCTRICIGLRPDWDFSPEGRIRQANRMKTLAQEAVANNRVVVADFICPTESTRQDFAADYTIWMDTIKEGRFEDTNRMFEEPSKYDFKVGHMDASMWAFLIKQDILDKHGNLGPHSK